MEKMIRLYDEKQEMYSETIMVEKISENKYRATENALFMCSITRNTEFTVKKIKEDTDGEIFVIDEITKISSLITRKLFWPNGYTKSDLQILGDELVKIGGFWQVDMGGIITVNYPESAVDAIEKFITDYDFKFTEIV